MPSFKILFSICKIKQLGEKPSNSMEQGFQPFDKVPTPSSICQY